MTKEQAITMLRHAMTHMEHDAEAHKTLYCAYLAVEYNSPVELYRRLSKREFSYASYPTANGPYYYLLERVNGGNWRKTSLCFMHELYGEEEEAKRVVKRLNFTSRCNHGSVWPSCTPQEIEDAYRAGLII